MQHIREKKSDLENQIAKAITDFELETETTVSGLLLDKFERFGCRSIPTVKLEITIQ